MAEETTPFPILRTKLHRPTPTVDLVPRPELLAWLDRHGNQPCILVSAPAGYGKTTLVSSWIETLDRPTAWLSLDDQDDDLAVFLAYLIAAVQTQFPHACQDTLALLNARSLPPLAVLVRRFSNDMEALDGNMTLVLDDYHVLHEMAIHNLLHELLQHPPRPLRLVVITRRDPPLSLATLRARDQMAEIRQQDLRFTAAETTAFLQRMMGTPVPDAVAGALAGKTEGWVTGLRLATLFHRHQGNLDVLLQDLPDNISYISEYLMAEVLSQQPPELQDFLMQTSISNGFCGELCDAVRGEGPLGVVNSRDASPKVRRPWSAYTRKVCFSFPRATSRSGIATTTCFRRSCRASCNAVTVAMRLRPCTAGLVDGLPLMILLRRRFSMPLLLVIYPTRCRSSKRIVTA